MVTTIFMATKNLFPRARRGRRNTKARRAAAYMPLLHHQRFTRGFMTAAEGSGQIADVSSIAPRHPERGEGPGRAGGALRSPRGHGSSKFELRMKNEEGFLLLHSNFELRISSTRARYPTAT